jgi:antitoxin (DNA-binding transcriptional repressor) of toxin-antitoxin stability system
LKAVCHAAISPANGTAEGSLESQLGESSWRPPYRIHASITYNTHWYTTKKGPAMQTISATELTRNTREILDRVSTRGETVTIERNHTMIAQIMPPLKTMTATQALAGLTFPGLTAPQAKTWLKDSRGGFDDTVSDPWA